MAKNTIKIDGTEYPCRTTMGALLRYRQETGEDFRGDSVTGNVTYLWCCVVSSCAHDGKKFEKPLLEFADALSAQNLMEWLNANQAESAGADDEKKVINYIGTVRGGSGSNTSFLR